MLNKKEREDLVMVLTPTLEEALGNKMILKGRCIILM
jgi:hypothetical protein